MISVLHRLAIFSLISMSSAHIEFYAAHDRERYLSRETMISLSKGNIQGYSSDLTEGSIHVYKGIPYGEPPESEYRFQRPTPKMEWDGYWDTTEYTPSCPSWDISTNTFNNGTEDCLYFNVFANARCKLEKCPVIVYMTENAAAEEKTIISKYATQNTVVVTFAYRTGIFGYLDLGISTEAEPYNAGFLALKTVHEEIERFGGDKSRVTVMAGTTVPNLVEYLMASPAVPSTWFQRAVINVDRLPQHTSNRNRQVTEAVVKTAGCEHTSTDRTLACLRELTDAQLAQVAHVAAGESSNQQGPQVDGDSLPYSTFDSMKKHWKQMPILIVTRPNPDLALLPMEEQCAQLIQFFGQGNENSAQKCVRHYATKGDLRKDALEAYAVNLVQTNSVDAQPSYLAEVTVPAGVESAFSLLSDLIKTFASATEKTQEWKSVQLRTTAEPDTQTNDLSQPSTQFSLRRALNNVNAMHPWLNQQRPNLVRRAVKRSHVLNRQKKRKSELEEMLKTNRLRRFVRPTENTVTARTDTQTTVWVLVAMITFGLMVIAIVLGFIAVDKIRKINRKPFSFENPIDLV